MEFDDKKIENGLMALFDCFEAKQRERDKAFVENFKARNPEIYEDIKIVVEEGDWESFDCLYKSRFSKMTESLIEGNSKYKWFFINAGRLERHLRHIFERFEGSACCADKARTLTDLILNYYKNEESGNCELDCNQKYTFHLPKKVLKDSDSIIEYAKGFYSLMVSGDFGLYIACLGKIAEQARSKDRV